METFGIILAGIWIAFWVYWLISAVRSRSSSKRRQSARPWIIFTLIAVLAWAALAHLAPPGFLQQHVLPDGTWTQLIGLAMTITGLGFAVWARIHLGKNWSSTPEIKVGHELIRTGPYRFVRNPIYTGLLFGYAGTAIAAGVVWAFVLILFLLGAFLLKIREEERFLLGEFGEEYEKYRREVRALIPYLL